MPPKKTTARAKKEPEKPEPVTVDGFETVDYEGMDLLQCERCEFNTFDLGSAKAHLHGHTISDTNAAELAELTENLADHAQVTTTEEPDDNA